MNFRSLYPYHVPAWLHDGGAGSRVLHSLSLLLDAAMQRIRSGLDARLPSLASDSALSRIGDDRGILRGSAEPAASYAARLRRWRYPRGHRTRGSGLALAEQVSDYFGGAPCWTIDASGNVCHRDADGTEHLYYDVAWAWGTAVTRARFWIIVDLSAAYTEQPPFGNADLWGGAMGIPGNTVGVRGMVEGDADAIRGMMRGRAWRPAGTQPEWLIVYLKPLSILPTPDATWQHWSSLSGLSQWEARDSALRYISLDRDHNNRYAGDPTKFAKFFPSVDDHGEDPMRGDAQFSTTVPMPSGAAYVGDATAFPADILLIDDGDFPV